MCSIPYIDLSRINLVVCTPAGDVPPTIDDQFSWFITKTCAILNALLNIHDACHHAMAVLFISMHMCNLRDNLCTELQKYPPSWNVLLQKAGSCWHTWHIFTFLSQNTDTCHLSTTSLFLMLYFPELLLIQRKTVVCIFTDVWQPSARDSAFRKQVCQGSSG